MTVQDRDILVRRLQEDLMGPLQEDEILSSRPSDVYLTGILWPSSTRMGGEDDDHLGLSGTSGSGGDGSSGGEEEEVARSGMNRPSTAGISFAVASPDRDPILTIRINYATYEKLDEEVENGTDTAGPEQNPASRWQRRPSSIEIPNLRVGPSAPSAINLEEHGAPPSVYLHRRIVPWGDNWLLTITLVNGYQVEWDRDVIEQHSLFQVRMEVRPGSKTRLIARPSRRMGLEEEQNEEDRSTALLYRNALEYAVGHTCSAEWLEGDTAGIARLVATTWIPQVVVPATSASGHPLFDTLRGMADIQPLSAEWLSQALDDELGRALSELPVVYNRWIESQEELINSLEDIYREQAARNLQNCRLIRDKMAEGAVMIGQNHKMAEAFRLANRAMHLQYSWNPDRRDEGPLTWRPFQLGFILLTILSIADRTHRDRNTMDLLWFPTGGGKTEAYLGLIAFLAFYRRLSAEDNPDAGEGVAAMMRYTLRLLTTQQFVRASAVILACEAIRRGSAGEKERSGDLGSRPFSIGLWVGGEATPNTYEAARQGLQGGSNLPSPAQLADCPYCGNQLEWYPNARTKSIRVRCNNREGCILHAGQDPLPVFTVDTDIYRERPTLLIGTVDKFSQIARKSQINGLFSIHSGNPPDLIVQDELHLISGPLGTLVGLYEVAIDRMFTREGAVPKIIGSTATIRRADDQVRALFNRDVCQFPPPAIDADDSGFAIREQDPDIPGRQYLGVTTAGRSAKFTLQAVASSLLQSATTDLTEEGQDNFWTMVAYFNSLRELGGAVVLMEDDVNDSMALLASRRSEQVREIDPPEELTSRRTQAEVRGMLDRLAVNANQDDALDAVLATNMLSVGVDIPRLGLMVVNGQPKGISEYIQVTSRVGRGRVPGLIVAVLNNAKPRDRSHYESFATWHRTLYRDVEATSVTPFASRARDRAMHAALVSLVRHLVPGMLDDPDLKPELQADIQVITDYIVNRANVIDPEETAVGRELQHRLNEWRHRNPRYYWDIYHPHQSLLQDAERAAALHALGRSEGSAWPTMNNLRSVEPSTRFRLAERLVSAGDEEDRNGQ